MRRQTYREPDSQIAAKRAAWARIKNGAGFLYVAEAIDTEVVKIGFSLTPERRMGQLRKTYGRPFRLLRMVPGNYKQERLLQHKLGALRIGRWQSELYPRCVLSHPAIPQALREAA